MRSVLRIGLSRHGRDDLPPRRRVENEADDAETLERRPHPLTVVIQAIVAEPEREEQPMRRAVIESGSRRWPV